MLTTAGCTRSAVGTIVYTTPAKQEVVIQSPVAEGCHRLPGGAYRVANYTLDDIRLYANAHCVLTPAGENQSGQIGGESFYLGTQDSVGFTPGQSPWLSYAVVGGDG
ncbi:hypothetical protein PV416_24555 [Streptomyces ipomoeae]|uniref:hypothetical protein n=1 Tax=Streptomyces ipomoeae TaxID=103232 RepID=UPI0011466ADB|nr:hypothetical protein [Streptomyces ipomoeae]MDX2824183.1 hypothetical protein [Streptomyces ipomoeae]MDX2874897.1 hypothetical protein [Streptomyces ipomoeae]MDX2934746.1 hypothetical protein [Streptomyces ipomoeae]TQE21068.1 hypothetical protein SipoB123_27395 [Streptomyces ipomoeae]TQE37231.1 hypothetical protein Sipo7851_09900 [Streptomyces ipomoeae]